MGEVNLTIARTGLSDFTNSLSPERLAQIASKNDVQAKLTETEKLNGDTIREVTFDGRDSGDTFESSLQTRNQPSANGVSFTFGSAGKLGTGTQLVVNTNTTQPPSSQPERRNDTNPLAAQTGLGGVTIAFDFLSSQSRATA